MIKATRGHISVKTIKTAVGAAVIMGVILLIGIMPVEPQKVNSFPDASKIAEEAQELAKGIVGKKVQVLKNEVLADLAKCETEGTKEPEGAIILDSNKEISIGKFMYQRKTVQFYAQKFYQKQVSRKDSILIALDAYPAIPLAELTEKILFEDVKGWTNWIVCSGRYDIQNRIKLINKFSE